MEESTKNLQNRTENTDRFQNIIKTLSKCKMDYVNERQECKTLREINSKLELELNEARELEKSHRYHLLSSREMIGSLQETVSQLVYLKRDVKKLKDEISLKEATLAEVEKEKENMSQKHKDIISELNTAHEKKITELDAAHESKVQQVHQEADAQIAQFTCVIEELQTKLKDDDNSYKDKMNVVVLEYEEKLQRGAAQAAQLQEQLARQAARTDANIDAYRRRLEELEEKLKQTQFKQYLAQTSYNSQYESQVERPYSVNTNYKDRYFDNASDNVVDYNPVLESAKPIPPTQNKAPQTSSSSTLQVVYYGNKTPNPQKNEKKGQFNITKKRKLYSDKDSFDF